MIIDNFLNNIILGDNLDLLESINDETIDLIITSPPYYKQRNYGGIGIGNEKTENEYLDNLLKVFKKCVRVLKSTGSIVFNLGDKYINKSLSLLPYKFAILALENTNTKLINNITWVKLNPTPRQEEKKLVQSAEPFFLFVKSDNYYFDRDNYMSYLDILKENNKPKPSNKLGNKYFDLINNSELSAKQKEMAKTQLNEVINEVKNGKIEGFRMKIKGIHSLPYGGQDGGRKIQIEKNGFTIIKINGKSIKRDIIESPVESIKMNKHPAIYPLGIIQQLIKLLSKKDDVVLDPFSGSGTTCIAANILKRNFIGIEINEEYVIESKKRLDEYRKNNAQIEVFTL